MNDDMTQEDWATELIVQVDGDPNKADRLRFKLDTGEELRIEDVSFTDNEINVTLHL
jgi:hypothetical protein